MYRLPHSAALLLSTFVLSYARHTIFISHNGEHSYLPDSSDPDVCMRPKCVTSAADILTSLDETVDPCDDFYRFACGGWIKRHDLEEDQPELNVMVKMKDVLNRKLRDLLESKYESSDPPFVKMLKDFYSTCMDLDNIEKAGSAPLKKILSLLGGMPIIEGKDWDESTFSWVDTLLSLRALGFNYNILIYFDVYFISRNETTRIIHLSTPYNVIPYGSNLTLGLSDTKILAHFKRMVKAAELLGIGETIAEKEMLEVVHFEMALENSTIEPEKDSDDEPTDEPIRTIKYLRQEVPQIPWIKYFSGLLNVEVNEDDAIDVRNLDFFIKLADLLSSTKKRVIANYIMMQVVLESADYLSKEWQNINKVMKESDEKEEKALPRWKQCMSILMARMERAMSAYYVRHYFSDESKDEAMMLMKYIHKEFLKLLKENDWMNEETKEKAQEKANAIKSYIGYPKELLNDTFVMEKYENLKITTDSHLENVMALMKITVDDRLSKLGMPKDFDELDKFDFIMEVNAFYNPYSNSIGIPAGILHDAFYEKDRPHYMNFGAIGYVIGHEITHGFDNKGRHFDKDGKEVSWWDKDSDEHFRKKVQCIIDQYDNYTTDIGMKVNGEKTQNENIADNGGLKEAYLAYQSWTKDNGDEPTLPGLKYTQNQLFWLSAAHVWCSKHKPEQLKEKLLMDPHSPDRYRIIGPMSNLEEFSKDFKCSTDSPMNRKYKCKVW